MYIKFSFFKLFTISSKLATQRFERKHKLFAQIEQQQAYNFEFKLCSTFILIFKIRLKRPYFNNSVRAISSLYTYYGLETCQTKN